MRHLLPSFRALRHCLASALCSSSSMLIMLTRPTWPWTAVRSALSATAVAADIVGCQSPSESLPDEAPFMNAATSALRSQARREVPATPKQLELWLQPTRTHTSNQGKARK